MHKNINDLENGNLTDEAWRILFEYNYKKVFKIAYSITNDYELSKDIVQVTFSKAFANINTLNDRTKFKEWICVIASNVSKDMLRKK